MDNELVRFARAFQTEDDLLKGIASLLRRRPGVSGVTITDGTHERGKDIVFYFTDVTGKPELQACVVKNTKITGSTGANNSASTVTAQARQALKTPYHAPNGVDQYVSHVLIMTPYELSQAALYSIQGDLRGQVSFCCGGELLKLFNEYWPDFLLDSGALGIYVTHLRANIDRDDPVAVLFSEHNLSALKRTYIKPHFHVLISRFVLQIDPPPVSEFIGKMTLHKVRILVTQLRMLLSLAGIEHFWYKQSKEERNHFRSRMGHFHDRLHQKWSAAYRQYERAVLAAKGTPLSRSQATVEVDWKPEEIAELSGCLEECHKHINYLKELIETVNRFASRATSADLNSPEYLSFCQLQEIANRARGIVVAQEPKKKLEIDQPVIETAKSILITGAAGYGKSSFCYHYAKADATALLEKKYNLLPVYIKLHSLASRALGSYQDEFFDTTELRSLTSRTNVEAVKRIDRIRIYLDGLDEIPRIDRQNEVLDLAKAAAQADSRVEVVITARDYVTGPWLNWMPRVHLSELSPDQIRSLVTGLLNDDESQVSQFYAELKKVPSLEPLMPVPLLATLIVSVFKKRTTLPETRVELYEIFLKLMCGGWDLAKNVRRPTEFGSRGKLSMLTRLAGHLHLNKEKTCTAQDIRIAVESSNPAFAGHTDELLEEIVQDGILTRNGATYEFKHLSFQEYLAAKDLNAPWDQKPVHMLKWYLEGDDWWYQPLTFYLGMLGKPPDTEEWIMTNCTTVNKSDRIYLARITKLLECVEESCPGGFTSNRLKELRGRLTELEASSRNIPSRAGSSR